MNKEQVGKEKYLKKKLYQKVMSETIISRFQGLCVFTAMRDEVSLKRRCPGKSVALL